MKEFQQFSGGSVSVRSAESWCMKAFGVKTVLGCLEGSTLVFLLWLLKKWRQPVRRTPGLWRLGLGRTRVFNPPHRLERPAIAENLRVWLLILERHHESCPVENWLKIFELLRAAVLLGEDFRWTPPLREAFETTKSHLVIHWMSEGLIPPDPPEVLPAHTGLSMPKQGQLKKYLAYLQQMGYSVRIRDWYRRVKELLALALRWTPDYHWDQGQRRSWALLIKMVEEMQVFDKVVQGEDLAEGTEPESNLFWTKALVAEQHQRWNWLRLDRVWTVFRGGDGTMSGTTLSSKIPTDTVAVVTSEDDWENVTLRDVVI